MQLVCSLKQINAIGLACVKYTIYSNLCLKGQLEPALLSRAVFTIICSLHEVLIRLYFSNSSSQHPEYHYHYKQENDCPRKQVVIVISGALCSVLRYLILRKRVHFWRGLAVAEQREGY